MAFLQHVLVTPLPSPAGLLTSLVRPALGSGPAPPSPASSLLRVWIRVRREPGTTPGRPGPAHNRELCPCPRRLKKLSRFDECDCGEGEGADGLLESGSAIELPFVEGSEVNVRSYLSWSSRFIPRTISTGECGAAVAAVAPASRYCPSFLQPAELDDLALGGDQAP